MSSTPLADQQPAQNSTGPDASASPPPPPLSVLMCAHNAAPFLREAVDSILTQSFRVSTAALYSEHSVLEFEFICVDDGSTDDTSRLLAEYAVQDARIRVHALPRRSGVGAALQAGLALVRSPLVARMDADDIALPDRLRTQVEYMQQHPEIDVLGSAVEVFRNESAPSSSSSSDAAVPSAATALAKEQSTCTGKLEATAKQSVETTSSALSTSTAAAVVPPRVITQPCSPVLVSWSLAFFCPLAHPSVMMRTEAVRRAGGYSPAWAPAEDLELWQRMSRAGCRMANVPEVLLRLRKHGANASSSVTSATVPDASAGASSALPRSAPLQQLHALMATQQHLSILLRAPVSLDLVQILVTPSLALRSPSTGLAAVTLLLRFEAALSESPQGRTFSAEDRSAVAADCTARLGELVVLAATLAAPLNAASQNNAADTGAREISPLETLQRTAARSASSALAPSFAFLPVASTATDESTALRSLWRLWLTRAPREASMKMAQLMAAK